VIRRPTDITGETLNESYDINLFELQCWVNDTNILFNNSSDLVSYFALWADKENDIGQTLDRVASLSYDNDISETGLSHSPTGVSEDIALIIKNVPKTSIQQIQSLVIYNRTTTAVTTNRAIGLAIELYNIDNDPNLETPLASTNVITTAEDVYRFDYPAIDTYPSGDFSDTNSITQIASETLALKEVVSEFAESANITGGLKVDTITTSGNVDISGNVSVSGSLSNPNQPCFKVIRTNTSISCVSGENLKFNEAVIDNRNGYDSTDFEYTIPVAGNWYFYYSFAFDDEELKVQLQQNTIVRDEITTVTITFPVKYSLGCKGMVIIPCVVNDVIRVRVENGSVSLNYVDELNSFGGFLIG
jgi:hypothetical protein